MLRFKYADVTKSQKSMNVQERISLLRVEIDSKINNSYLHDYLVLKSKSSQSKIMNVC